MHVWRVAGGLGRLGILVLFVIAVSALATTAPASARSHALGRHHYHFARRHGVPLRASSVASPYQFGFAPFATSYTWRQGRYAKANRLPDNRRAGNGWNTNSGNGWQSNPWNSGTQRSAFGGSSEIGGMAATQAGAAGVPTSLVDRVIKRESGGNPRAVSRGNYGLMQIRLGTARAMGYTGSAAGLLDPQTNMTYAVRYLAGAYRAAGGNENRAVALYARGYYDVTKAQGFSPQAFSRYGSSSGGSYQMASNYGGPGFNDQPAQWQSEQPSAGGTRLRVRHFRHPA